MLEKLTQAWGVSGYESDIRKMILDAVKDDSDDVLSDALGNLIVHKKGTGEHKKKIMLAAHMDEIGFQVTKIDEKGQIKFKSLGYAFLATTYMSRVRFRNGTVGIISSVTEMQDVKDLTKLYIDIGVKTKEEALQFVKVGDVACHIGEYAELKGGNVTAKALDDRIGCYILIEVLKRLSKPYNDLYFVFTVQEELGCRGSKVTAQRISPDIGIAVDITPAHDYPCDQEGSNTLGDGAAIKVSDPSVVCDEYLVSEMVKCCEENQIKYQYDVIYRGGTDTSSINLSNYGVRVAAVSVATRFPHGPNSMINMGDAECSIELLQHYLNRNFAFDAESYV